jgi:hypothetical protein
MQELPMLMIDARSMASESQVTRQISYLINFCTFDTFVLVSNARIKPPFRNRARQGEKKAQQREAQSRQGGTEVLVNRGPT